jgi:hypothetical protein
VHGAPYGLFLMIKTLRITSVAAVLFAVVVLASVLGFLQPASLLHLNLAVRSDKQTEKILSGPSAVDRFKELYGNRGPDGKDTTPPLVKQAQIFASIINPPPPTGPTGNLPPKPTPGRPTPLPTPVGPVSSKFDLLGTSYSSDPTTSFAYIRMPGGTTQWVGVGCAIGHVTIKEIRNGSIVCSDGNRDFDMNTEPTPETSSLLETGKTANNAVTSTSPSPAVASTSAPVAGTPQTPGRITSVRPQISGTANAPTLPTRPSVASSRAAALGTPVPPAQISPEEQESLSELGNRLKAAAGGDSNATTNRMVSDYQSSLGAQPQPGSVPNPTQPAEAYKGTWKENMKKEEVRRQLLQRRLAVPNPLKKK